MRRKQLFALAMAGALSINTAPAALLAGELPAEDAALVSETSPEGAAAAGETEQPADPAAAEVPAEAATEAPAEPATEPVTEPVTEAATEPVTEPVTEAAAEPVTEATTEAVTEAPVETPAPTDTPAPAEEEKKNNSVTNEAELSAAIEAAPADASTVINIANDFAISNTITVPAGKKIFLATMAPQARISRADGFTGDMFAVYGVLSFLKANNSNDSGQSSGILTVDGALTNGTAAGSIIHVYTEQAIFAIDDSAVLTGNNTTAKGGAVYNEGIVLLLGGRITGNKALDGGAIYSEHLVSIEGSADVTGNYEADVADAELDLGDEPEAAGSALPKENNIALEDGASLNIDGEITIGRAGIHAVDPEDGKVLVTMSEAALQETTPAEALLSIHLDDESEFKLDASGRLIKVAAPEEDSEEEAEDADEAADEAETDEEEADADETDEEEADADEEDAAEAEPTATPVPVVTPDLMRIYGPEWVDENTASITCESDMDGSYYAAVALEGEENIPVFDLQNEPGTEIKKGEPFEIVLPVPEEEGNYVIYVLVKGENGTLSAKKAAPLNPKTRYGIDEEAEEPETQNVGDPTPDETTTPAPEESTTPAPEETVTPTPTPTSTPTPTPTSTPTPTPTPAPKYDGHSKLTMVEGQSPTKEFTTTFSGDLTIESSDTSVVKAEFTGKPETKDGKTTRTIRFTNVGSGNADVTITGKDENGKTIKIWTYEIRVDHTFTVGAGYTDEVTLKLKNGQKVTAASLNPSYVTASVKTDSKTNTATVSITGVKSTIGANKSNAIWVEVKEDSDEAPTITRYFVTVMDARKISLTEDETKNSVNRFTSSAKPTSLKIVSDDSDVATGKITISGPTIDKETKKPVYTTSVSINGKAEGTTKLTLYQGSKVLKVYYVTVNSADSDVTPAPDDDEKVEIKSIEIPEGKTYGIVTLTASQYANAKVEIADPTIVSYSFVETPDGYSLRFTGLKVGSTTALLTINGVAVRDYVIDVNPVTISPTPTEAPGAY